MNDQQQQPAPLAPANAAEAWAALDARLADKSWNDRYLNGDVEARKDFEALTQTIAARGDAVDQAIAGIVPGEIKDAGQKQMAEAAAWITSGGYQLA